MSKWVWIISKGVCPREYVIVGRGKTVSLFLTEALWRFEVWSKWSKLKNFVLVLDSSEVT